MIKKAASVLEQGGLYALLVLLPFSKAACEITFAFMLAGWLINRLNPETRGDSVWFLPKMRPLVFIMLAFLGVCTLSITVSAYPLHGVRALFSKWMEYLLFFVIAADIVQRPKVLKRALFFLALGACGTVTEAFIQKIRGVGLLRHYRYDVFHRMTGPYENPNDLATYCMVTIPILTAAAVGLWRRPAGWLCALPVIPLGVCLYESSAVGAWMGLAAGLAVIPFCYRRSRWPALILLSCLVLTGSVFLLQDGRLELVQEFLEDRQSERMPWFRASLAMISDRPVLGHGLNSYMAKSMDYWVGGTHTPVYAHNCYFQMAAETGLAGLTLFLGMLGWVMVMLIKALSELDARNRLMLTGGITALSAFLVQAAVDTNFYSLRQSVLFWVVLGMTLGFTLMRRSVKTS